MALVFNPFTGNFDNVMASSSDMSFSGGSLNVNGDITLDSGGAFTTTVQAVTPTANRTISFPDQTGTVALVNGANGTIQYNNAGALNGNSDFTVDPDWNDASTVFTGLKLNVTNTASASGSNLLDLQVNGSRKFSADKDGIVSAPFFIAGNGTTGVDYFYGPNLYAGTRTSLGSAAYLGWTSGLPNVSNDLTLFRDDANILAQRNGTASQTFRLYNTYTDASNYERGFFQWNSNVLEIGSEGLGTGSEQPVRITAATLKLPNLPTYADNAAASAVLAVGDVYKTATGELRIVV